jgi:hypothetical protein
MGYYRYTVRTPLYITTLLHLYVVGSTPVRGAEELAPQTLGVAREADSPLAARNVAHEAMGRRGELSQASAAVYDAAIGDGGIYLVVRRGVSIGGVSSNVSHWYHLADGRLPVAPFTTRRAPRCARQSTCDVLDLQPAKTTSRLGQVFEEYLMIGNLRPYQVTHRSSMEGPACHVGHPIRSIALSTQLDVIART